MNRPYVNIHFQFKSREEFVFVIGVQFAFSCKAFLVFGVLRTIA